ncbi:CHAT domain-containing protein [Carboxylicivirga sp. N1Y90]|uniref:CHAT domain-containing protein n=1 Tax=Carboxylicivirga fragile TaxID=3417571 RepID=UPI003D33CE33|nr:CHAT domain-containing protein [Marinilabiliaceae bacterium N1Y90]
MLQIRFIILIILILTLPKNNSAQTTITNIIIIKNEFNSHSYESVIQKGNDYFISKNKTLLEDEELHALACVLKSFNYTERAKEATDFLTIIEQKQKSVLFDNYIQLYKGSFYIILNKREEAISLLEDLLKTGVKEFLVDSVLTKIYSNLGTIHSINKEHKSALDYFEQAFNIDKRLLIKTGDYENFNTGAASYLQKLGNVYCQYEKVIEQYHEIFAYPFNHDIETHNYYLFATYITVCSYIGNDADFEKYTNRLEKFYLEQSPNLKSDLAFLYFKKGDYLFIQKKYTEANSYYKKAISLMVAEESYHNKRPNSFKLLAISNLKLGKEKLSIYYAKEAIKESKIRNGKRTHEYYAIAAQVNAFFNKPRIALAYLDSAIIYRDHFTNSKYKSDKRFEEQLAKVNIHLKNYSKALYHFEELNEILNHDANYGQFEFWENKNNIAHCYIGMEQYETAILLIKELHDEIISQFQKDIETNPQSHIARLFRRANLNLSKALYLYYKKTQKKDDLEEAYKHLSQANQSIDYLRSQLNFDSDQMATGESYAEYIELGMKINSDLYALTKDKTYLESSYEFVQKGKSYSLLIGVNDKQWKINAGLPAELIKDEGFFKGRVQFYQNEYETEKFSSEPREDILSHLDERMSFYMQKMDSINAIIKTNYPRYFQLKYAPQYASIEDIQKRLGGNHVLLDYYLLKNQIHTYTIIPNTFHHHISEVDSSFHQNLNLVINEVASPFIAAGNTIQRIQEFAKASHQLYHALFENNPVDLKNKNLIVVPHQELAYLPFETLLTKDVSEAKPDFRRYPWLLNENTISYTYNASLLPKHSEKAITFNKVTSFAPKYTGSTSQPDSILIAIRSTLNNFLMPLNAAQEEIQNIDKLFRSEVYNNEQATKANFLNTIDENNVLHLAMHSLNDEVQPLNSQLVFSANNDTSDVLKAFEIYNYNIESPMVVLSACNTGRGKKKSGEGLISLARAFTFSGVQTQIMTLWPVHDKSGATLTELFYKNLKNDNFKDVAMQKAKQDFIANSDGIRSHPYYWANYVVSGNTSPIKQGSHLIWYLLASIGLISLITVLLIKLKKRH